jgi:hypothetical protein
MVCCCLSQQFLLLRLCCLPRDGNGPVSGGVEQKPARDRTHEA